MRIEKVITKFFYRVWCNCGKPMQLYKDGTGDYHCKCGETLKKATFDHLKSGGMN